MAEENNNQQTPAPEKSGCMTWLGVLLLIAAVAAVLLYFIAKPALEEKGVDVQGELQDVKSKTVETVSTVKENLINTGEKISGKYDTLQKSAEKVSESDTGKKIKDGAEKVKTAGEEVVEKAKEGESWY